ncbi:ethanolamine ammonia-lyase subunit EutB [Anaerolinea thermophila]|uniref:Ethanolamine ammonia-lyase large subunit n=1 Tax=Anaerolinea thermophila (strain DSM 14523 / JCM 11388 / NBRC 100420 / UNI-1) TaxID=926569 RepID=E8N2E7_ANATU|nr:ethanolamine ammonia-lyase subunit EutB [Anaerolinea thermophila]BAJ62753.1 ethanolamine ammonia lyase heavy chain [Anaerolinea thermophila UNI-1]
MLLRTKLFGNTYEFGSIKEVMAKANEEKSGDRLAGIAARSVSERMAARYVLAEVTLETLRNHPAVPYEQDEVTRVIQDSVNETIYNEIKHWTVGEFREWLLADTTTGDMIKRISNGLTAEMVAAVTKLMSNMDLMVAARKIRITAHCNNTIGLEGTLASRNQPNHPTDSPEGIRATIYEGLSFGSGDSVIGINPVDDSLGSVMRLLEMTYDIIQKWEIPTQNCVLAHVTTQMEAMRRGAPVGLVFQSLAGSQKANEAFGVTVAMMDEAYEMAKKYCWTAGPNYMYFETGQGTALSADAHYNTDQLTMEARIYGLAKRYKPFQVNTVVGFIGPEYLYDSVQITRAGLEDHFMGKLTGIPMGCDACYTNHAKATQNDIENLAVLLTAAGCNYFMGVPMGDDVMLSYQCTSYHDTAALRQLLGLRPSPEFEKWMESIGLMENGKLTEKAGDASFFLQRK